MRTGGWLDIQSALWFLVSLTNSTVPALEFAPWHSCTLIDLIRFDWFDLIRLPRPWWSSRSPQSSHCGMEWRRIRLERTDSMCSTMHRSIDRWSVGRMIQWMESINQSITAFTASCPLAVLIVLTANSLKTAMCDVLYKVHKKRTSSTRRIGWWIHSLARSTGLFCKFTH